MSPARTSPFVCLADIVVTLVWMGHGLRNGIGWYGSARRLTKDFGYSDQEDRILFSKPGTVIFLLLLTTGTCLQAIKVFIWGGVGRLPWIQTLAAAAFFTAYILRVITNTLSRLYSAEKVGETADRYINEAPKHRVKMFQFADVLFCSAYAVQFRLWITIFRDLKCPPAVAVTMIALAMGGSWKFPTIFHGFWSLKTWNGPEKKSLALVLFILVLVIPAEHVSDTVATPLTAFGVVVLQVGLVSLLGWIRDKIRLKHRKPTGTGVPTDSTNASAESSEVDPKALKERWNPVVRADKPWRQKVTLAFGLSNLVFTILYYTVVYDPAGTKKPASTDEMWG